MIAKKALSQKDIACFAACHEERPPPFDVQLIVQLFSPEMLEAELDFVWERISEQAWRINNSPVVSRFICFIIYIC